MRRRLRSSLKALGVASCLLAAGVLSSAEGVDPDSYPADRVDEIVVETDGGPISLAVMEGPVVSVRATTADSSCKVSRSIGGGRLVLTAHGPASRMFALDRRCSTGFEIGGPAGLRITARSVAGPVSVGPFAGPVDVKTGAGRISLAGPSGFLMLHSGRGDISGTTRGPQTAASTQTGDISFSGLTGQVTARSVSGSISLVWTAAPRRGMIEVLTRSGSQSLAMPAGASIDLSIRSDSGRAVTDFARDPRSELRMQLRSETGSIALKKLRPS
jgi:hypothetical protein